MPAATGVHRRDELKARRPGDVRIGASNLDLPGLERLAEGFEHRALEFGQLVHKQHASVRERDLTWAGVRSAAHHRGHRSGMVRCSKRSAAREATVDQAPAQTVDHPHFQHFGWIKRRQDADKARRQHRFSGTRRADHEQVVATSRRDLKSAFGRLLTLDLFEIGQQRRILDWPRLGWREHLQATGVIDERKKCGRS